MKTGKHKRPNDKRLSPLRRAVLKVEEAAPTIVGAVIKQARKGSYLHAKFLFDFARLSAPDPHSEERASLARLLLDELRLAPPAAEPSPKQKSA